MKTFHRGLLLAAGMALTGSVAFAQDEDRKVIYKDKTEIDFEDVDVEGDLKKPHGAYLLDRRRGNFNPLIKIRTDFNDQILRSVDEVR